MPVTVAPSTEAMAAIVTRINSGGAYTLAVSATYCEELVDILEVSHGLKVDVVSESEEDMDDTLDVECRTSHQIRIWVRKKVDAVTNAAIDPLKLLVRQIFQRVNNYNTTDQRVKVWECDIDPKECPIKDVLRENWLFVATILLRVEVEPSP